MKDFVYVIGYSGQLGFNRDDKWMTKHLKNGDVCRQCLWIKSERVTKLDYVGVTDSPKNHHVGSISEPYNGVVLSDELIDLLGRNSLKKQCHLIDLKDEDNPKCADRYSLAIERNTGAVVRGSLDSRPSLCETCGRLMYWPIGRRYLLRSYWGKGLPQFRILEDNLLVTQAVYEKEIKTRKLTRLTATKLPILDEPLDGLPIKYADLIKALKRA